MYVMWQCKDVEIAAAYSAQIKKSRFFGYVAEVHCKSSEECYKIMATLIVKHGIKPIMIET